MCSIAMLLLGSCGSWNRCCGALPRSSACHLLSAPRYPAAAHDHAHGQLQAPLLPGGVHIPAHPGGVYARYLESPHVQGFMSSTVLDRICATLHTVRAEVILDAVLSPDELANVKPVKSDGQKPVPHWQGVMSKIQALCRYIGDKFLVPLGSSFNFYFVVAMHAVSHGSSLDCSQVRCLYVPSPGSAPPQQPGHFAPASLVELDDEV